jgi:uncharacterized protein (TIGR00369 family)
METTAEGPLKYEIPLTKRCFGCGTENECGLGLRPVRDGEYIRATYKPKPAHRGFSRTLHGGLVAALVDEVLAMAVGTEVLALVATVELTVKYLKPVPMDEELLLEARDIGFHEGTDRRRDAEGRLLDARGNVLATARGVYQLIPADRMGKFLNRDESESASST